MADGAAKDAGEAAGAARRAEASAWFETLQGRICAAFEALEAACGDGPYAGMEAGRFERKATRRKGVIG
ncbi:MAG: coproporphyrinogen III oxidase, partial [Pseudomonadota bacterium]